MNADPTPSSGANPIQTQLKARALALAQPLESPQPPTEQLRVVEFLLGHERHAIETRFVREVCQIKEIIPIPCTPPFICGMINVRGRIVSVINLKQLFDLPHTEISGTAKVLIVSWENVETGFLTDAVIGSRLLDSLSLQPLPSTLSGARANYLRGVTNERLIVLKPENILTDQRIIVNDKME